MCKARHATWMLYSVQNDLKGQLVDVGRRARQSYLRISVRSNRSFASLIFDAT